MRWEFDLGDLDDLAVELVSLLKLGQVVCLHGDMGVGKTTLVRSMCNVLHCSSDAVTSPTFSLVNVYDGDPVVYHMDLYRLRGEEDVMGLDLERYFLDVNALSFVEWPERLGRFKPLQSFDWVLTFVMDGGSDLRMLTMV